jgi:hypothetical protein
LLEDQLANARFCPSGEKKGLVENLSEIAAPSSESSDRSHITLDASEDLMVVAMCLPSSETLKSGAPTVVGIGIENLIV